jgi:hypothetical protein
MLRVRANLLLAKFETDSYIKFKDVVFPNFMLSYYL